MSKRQMLIPGIALLLCLTMAAAICAQDVRKEGRYWVGEITKTFKVDPNGRLIMEDVRGDITIQTWSKNEVKIEELKKMDIFSENEAKTAMRETESGYEKSGNTIRIGGPAFDRNWIESRFNITLPSAFNCDVETDGGDLDISKLQGEVRASTGGGDILLNTIDGDVRVKTGGGDIEILKTTKNVDASTGGGEINIDDVKGAVEASTGGGDITIRNAENRTRVSTGGGDIDIEDTKGEVIVSTGGGEIRIVRTGGDVKLSTGGGEIDVREVSGNFEASTGGGEITAQTVEGDLDLSTGGGDIELEDIRGSLEVSTGGGDISADITLDDFSKDHHIEISTGGGEIDLKIPPNMPATIDAEIKYRRRSWEDYEITSDFSLQITTEDEDSRYRIIRARGDINGGGDPIRLRSGGGNIRIRKNR